MTDVVPAVRQRESRSDRARFPRREAIGDGAAP